MFGGGSLGRCGLWLLWKGLEEVLEFFLKASLEERFLEEGAFDGLVELVVNVVADDVCELRGLAFLKLALRTHGWLELVRTAVFVLFGLHSNQQLVIKDDIAVKGTTSS